MNVRFTKFYYFQKMLLARSLSFSIFSGLNAECAPHPLFFPSSNHLFYAKCLLSFCLFKKKVRNAIITGEVAMIEGIATHQPFKQTHLLTYLFANRLK